MSMRINAYQKTLQLFWLNILISFFSCSASKDINMTTAANDTYNWTRGNSYVTENFSAAFAGYNLGYALFGDIESKPNRITFSCGYRIDALPREAKHYDDEEHAVRDDGPLDDFEITGVVLLALATQNQNRFRWNNEYVTVFVSDVLRIAKTVDEIERPEEVFFENVSLTVDNPKCPEGFERCWGEVHPTFIICWDNPQIGVRAYQFIRPTILSPGSLITGEVHPGCDRFNGHPFFSDHLELIQGLGVYWPLIDKYAKQMEVAPKQENWTDWIDEILPRP